MNQRKLEALARTVLLSPHRQHYGLELAKEIGEPIGSIYPELRVLESAGWLESDWDENGRLYPDRGNRPRRFYALARGASIRDVVGTFATVGR